MKQLLRTRITSLLALSFVPLTPAAAEGGAAPAPCRETLLKIERKQIAINDSYLAPRIRSSKSAINIKFLGPTNPVRSRQIIAVSYLGSVTLDDNSEIFLQRNVNSDGAITGAGLASPECRSDWVKSSNTTATLNTGAKMRLEHAKGEHRLVDFSAAKVFPWIVTRRRVDGFDISPPPIDSPGDRSILLVTVEQDKSLTFAWYALRTTLFGL